MSESNAFVSRALTLVDNGYRVIPIQPGGKAPAAGKGWQDLHADEKMVRKWGSNGLANANIGVITESTPAVDIDIYDAAMAERMEQWVLDNVVGADSAPCRVGQAPKRLLLFRSTEVFHKQQAGFTDPQGKKHKVEILSAGQQFVAFGIHPDTKRPFTWVSMTDPLDTPVDELPVLSLEDARRIVAEFERMATEAGWKRTGNTTRTTMVSASSSDGFEDGLLNYKRPLKTDAKEIRAALKYLSPDDSYDRWLEVGMALHHQFEGGDDGMALWDEWSSESAHYDRDEMELKWPTFNTSPDGRSAVTVATLFKYANDARATEQTEKFERVLNVIRTTSDVDKLFKDVCKEVAKACSHPFQYDIAATKIQERAKELTNVAPRIETIRKALANARSKKPTDSHVPEWCQDWVYLENGDRFFHLETKQEVTERGFNAKFDREIISEEDRAVGVAAPDAHAAQKALNVYNIPTVYSTVYLPGHPRVVEVLGRMRANTFDETSIPAAKEAETDDEREAIRIVEQHFRVTFPDLRERTIIIDYLAYNVQCPAEKIAWALLIQGAEGTGKTWLLKFMQMMLGPQNVSPLSAAALQEPTNNAWAEGSKMLFIEEIRLHGANRYEILDKLKEPVSNEDITIRRMQRDRYMIPNVTNYGAFTNYWDAVPLSKNNRRYFVVATQIQSDEDVARFNKMYPNYFDDLFGAIFAHPAVLRGWLLSRQLSDWFEPKRPAPDTAARAKMADLSEISEESDALMTIMEKSEDLRLSRTLVTLPALEDAANNLGLTLPKGRALMTILIKAGFHSLGRIVVDEGGDPVRCFTREPSRYDLSVGSDLSSQARDFLAGKVIEPRKLLGLDEDEGEDW